MSYLETLLGKLGVSEDPGWTDEFGKALRLWIQQNGIPPVRTLSLFTGAGGLDIGFHDAGFDVVSMVEIDPASVETLRANKKLGVYFKDARIYCQDIGVFDPLDLPNVDLVIGGPPCQTFSAAGRRAAGAPGLKDSRGELYKQFVRILAAIRPRTFLFENVYGLTGVENGEAWKAILSDFQRLGYRVSHRILDAAGYGVPQHRERLIVVGVRGMEFLFPRPTHGIDSLDQHPYYTPREALLNLEEQEKPSPVSGKWGYLLREIPPGLNYSFFTSKMNHPRPIFAWRSKFSDFLYKADPHTPVRAIKASGGQYTGPFHWESRPFSLNELKKLQTFPDEYLIVGSRQTATRQIGNAVPPQLARMLALALLSQVWEVKLPTQIELLDKSESLKFRTYKKEMTTVYQELAAEALGQARNRESSERRSEEYPASYLYSARLNVHDFSFAPSVEEGPRLRVDVNAGMRLLSLHVKSEETEDQSVIDKVPHVEFPFIIEVLPSVNGWDIPFQEIRLEGSSLSREVFLGLWKALECYLAEIKLKADLVQLCGYYQYEPRLRCRMVFGEQKPLVLFWRIVKQVVEGVAVRQILPLVSIAELWNTPVNDAATALKQLRLLGYEVRGHSTNVSIPEECYLIPYSFPTLGPKSVQLRKHLKVIAT